MNQKLIICNIIVLVLVFIAFIGGFFLFHYPVETSIKDIPDDDWIVFGIILVGILGFSILSAFLFFNKIPFWKKVGITTISFNLILIGYLTYHSTTSCVKNVREFQELEKFYKEEASKDIKNNNIDYTYAFVGEVYSELDTISDKKFAQLDSVYSKYGLKFRIIGILENDLYIPINEKAKEKYEEIIQKHLEQRNGKNWEEKLEKELNNIEKSSAK